MATYNFTIEVTTDSDATEQEVKDFIAFECGASCCISNDNPFMDDSSEAEIDNVEIY